MGHLSRAAIAESNEMNQLEQSRFDFLRSGHCVPFEYVRDYYGITCPLQECVGNDFENWRAALKRPAQCNAGEISRYELESFMQLQGIVPKKWMAARLGMQSDSLSQVVLRLPTLRMHPQRYEFYPELIAETLPDDLLRNLPGLKFRTFSDHDRYCEQLHADLEKTLGLQIQPLYCATAERLGKSDRWPDFWRRFARNFDCITLEPISAKHQVWLNLGKPLNLPADRCSKLFYAENRDVLQQYCAGTSEPDDIDEYMTFLTSQMNA